MGSGDVRCVGGVARDTTCTSCPASAMPMLEFCSWVCNGASCALRALRWVVATGFGGADAGCGERDLLIRARRSAVGATRSAAAESG